jgi:hypothetical protein
MSVRRLLATTLLCFSISAAAFAEPIVVTREPRDDQRPKNTPSNVVTRVLRSFRKIIPFDWEITIPKP